MTIRSKVLLLLLAMTCVQAVALLLVHTLVLAPSLEDLDREEAASRLARCNALLAAEASLLAAPLSPILAPASEGVPVARSNRPVPAPELLAVVAPDFRESGRVLSATFRAGREGPDLVLPESCLRTLLDNAPDNAAASGICLDERGPLLLAAGPLLGGGEARAAVERDGRLSPDSLAGAERCRLIAGARLDAPMVRRIAEAAGVAYRVSPLWGGSTPPPSLPEPRAGEAQADAGSPPGFDSAERSVRVFMTLRDLTGAPALVSWADVPRSIAPRGEWAMGLSMGLSILAGVLTLGALWWLLNRVLVRPVIELSGHMAAIRREGDHCERLPERRGDELGRLAAEYNSMLDRLGESRCEILKQSFSSGMSEMASEVLHNVRNTHAPLKANVCLLLENFRMPLAGQFEAEARRLLEDGWPKERAPELNAALEHLSGRLGILFRVTGERLQKACDMAEQVERDLEALESQGRGSRLLEPLRLQHLLADGLFFVPPGLRHRLDVSSDPDIADLPPVLVDRVAILEVLANVLANAAEAVREVGRETARVRVTARLERVDDEETVLAEIADDGPGLAPQSLAEIFRRGYVSGKKQKYGLGLHWCACAVGEMKGSIAAHSDGPGTGLRVLLRLRVAPAA